MFGLSTADYQRKQIEKSTGKRSRVISRKRVALAALAFCFIGAVTDAQAPVTFRAELDDCSIMLASEEHATQAERDAVTLFSVIPDDTRFAICDAIRSAPETDQHRRNS